MKRFGDRRSVFNFPLKIAIIGGGLAGLSLAYQFVKHDQNVTVYDANHLGAASQLSAGMLTPITGSHFGINWNFQRFFPSALHFYQSLEFDFNGSLLTHSPYFRFFRSKKEQSKLNRKFHTYPFFQDWISTSIPLSDHSTGIQNNWGGFQLNDITVVNIQFLVRTLHDYFVNHGCLLDDAVDYASIRLLDNSAMVGNSTYDRIIFCDGFSALNNPFFEWVPHSIFKSDVLTFRCDSLLSNAVYNRGKWFQPLGNHCYKVGSTHYSVETLNAPPESAGYNRLSDFLADTLSVPYSILSYRSAFKMSVPDSRPVLGQHPSYSQLYICNGFGSKGALAVPFCVNEIVSHVLDKKPIFNELDVSRWNH